MREFLVSQTKRAGPEGPPFPFRQFGNDQKATVIVPLIVRGAPI